MLPTGSRFYHQFFIPQAVLIANVAFDTVAPCDGYIEELQVIVDTAVTTGGTLKARINAVDTAGCVVTIANGATKGTVVSDVPDEPSATRRFKKGDRISILPTGFATAGSVNGNLIMRDSATLSA